jgi:hypothetical protein
MYWMKCVTDGRLHNPPPIATSCVRPSNTIIYACLGRSPTDRQVGDRVRCILKPIIDTSAAWRWVCDDQLEIVLRTVTDLKRVIMLRNTTKLPFVILHPLEKDALRDRAPSIEAITWCGVMVPMHIAEGLFFGDFADLVCPLFSVESKSTYNFRFTEGWHAYMCFHIMSTRMDMMSTVGVKSFELLHTRRGDDPKECCITLKCVDMRAIQHVLGSASAVVDRMDVDRNEMRLYMNRTFAYSIHVMLSTRMIPT